MNVAEIEEIRAEAVARELTYAFSRQSRFNSKMLAVKRLVEDGALGQVYFARAERVRSRGIPVGIGGWFLEKSKAGGGAMIDIGVHALDAAWYLAGCPRPISVVGQVSQRFGHTLPVDVKYDVEDTGFAMIRFEGGFVMHLEVTWAGNLTDAVPQSTWAGHELEDTTLYGDRATVRLNPPTLYTMDGMERVATPLSTGPESDGFEAQLRNFLAAIKTGTPPVSNVDQAVRLMQMLMAIYESSESGREVRLGG
jgi:predicted dehydrogenase